MDKAKDSSATASSSGVKVAPAGKDGAKKTSALSDYFLSFHDSKFVPSKPLSIVLMTLYGISGSAYYAGPYFGFGNDVALFFGVMYDAHLMKTVGLLLLLMSLLNLATALHLSRGITVFTFIANLCSFAHFSVESFWHRELYLSVMVPICLVVIVQVVNSLLLERKSMKVKELEKKKVK